MEHNHVYHFGAAHLLLSTACKCLGVALYNNVTLILINISKVQVLNSSFSNDKNKVEEMQKNKKRLLEMGGCGQISSLSLMFHANHPVHHHYIRSDDGQADRWCQAGVSMDYDVCRQHCDL